MTKKNQQKLPLVNMLDENNSYSGLDSKFFILIIALIALIIGIFLILQTNNNHQQEILDITSEISSTENLLLKKQQQINDLNDSIGNIELEIKSINEKVLIIGQELDQLVAGQLNRSQTYHSILNGNNENLKILKILENSKKEIQIMGEAKNIENLGEFQNQLNSNLSIENLRWGNTENGLLFTAQITEN